VDLPEFERMVRRLAREIPDEYLTGIVAVDVSPKAVPHPTRADVYTLGECIPLHGDADEIQSRVILYHGSFRALAGTRDDFAWREEAWETLTHELRHHLEWRASADALEAFDWAADQNFARQEGAPFDPVFHLSGERVENGVYRIDDDVFLDRVVHARPAAAELVWHGAPYRVDVPPVALPLFLTLEGLREPPPGEVVLVLRRRPRLWDLFRRPVPPVRMTASARPG
jgi:Zincin-like metallopeptidase